jgi:hypothetical protein
MAKISDEVFNSDAHRLMMRDNYRRRAEQLERSQQLLSSLYQYTAELNSERTYPTHPYIDSYGNKFKFIDFTVDRTGTNLTQPDDGVYKRKVAFKIYLTVRYQFFDDKVPPTVLTEPIKKMWEIIQDRFSEYGLEDFDFFIGVVTVSYVLQSSDPSGGVHNLGSVMPSLNSFTDNEKTVKCDKNFENNLSGFIVSNTPKISQPEFNKEYLDRKYNKIYNVLRKGNVKLSDGRSLQYELEDVGGDRFIYRINVTVKTEWDDVKVISSTRPRVRLIQNIFIEDTPDEIYGRGTDVGDQQHIVNAVHKKFKQFGMEIEIKRRTVTDF